jgi:RNA polymerase sigma-70 factor (ECF subfamily)
MAQKHDSWGATRRTLLERLKNADDHAGWQTFFDTYGPLIYGVARRAGLTDAEAQDVVQETVLTVSKNISEFEYDPARGRFKSWLLHTTRWRIVDQLRKRLPSDRPRATFTSERRRTRTTDRIADPHGSELEKLWDEEWVQRMRELALERVKRQVKPRQYQVFDSYVVKGWPVTKVTAALGVSTTQVYLAKHRVGMLLRREIMRLEKALV